MILRTKAQETFASFEEDFNVPAFSMDSDNLFFAKGHIRADQ